MPSEDVEAIDDAIALQATKPLRVKTDTGEVEGRPMKDLLLARNHMASSSAGSRPRRGLRFTRLIPPGAV